MTPNAPKEILRIDEVADYLNVSKRSIYRLIKRDPAFPSPSRVLPGRRRWSRREIDKWLDTKKEMI